MHQKASGGRAPGLALPQTLSRIRGLGPPGREGKGGNGKGENDGERGSWRGRERKGRERREGRERKGGEGEGKGRGRERKEEFIPPMFTPVSQLYVNNNTLTQLYPIQCF